MIRLPVSLFSLSISHNQMHILCIITNYLICQIAFQFLRMRSRCLQNHIFWSLSKQCLIGWLFFQKHLIIPTCQQKILRRFHMKRSPTTLFAINLCCKIFITTSEFVYHNIVTSNILRARCQCVCAGGGVRREVEQPINSQCNRDKVALCRRRELLHRTALLRLINFSCFPPSISPNNCRCGIHTSGRRQTREAGLTETSLDEAMNYSIESAQNSMPCTISRTVLFCCNVCVLLSSCASNRHNFQIHVNIS